jgi:hypothetical protein
MLMLARNVTAEDFIRREKTRGSQEIYEKWGRGDADNEQALLNENRAESKRGEHGVTDSLHGGGPRLL